MVFGIGKKKSRRQLASSSAAAAGPSSGQVQPAVPEIPDVQKRASSRPAKGTAPKDDDDDDEPPPPASFKYGNDISKATVDIAGLPVNVFGLNELTPAPSRASAPRPPPICLIIHMHGRGGSADNEEKIVRQLYDRISRDKAAHQNEQNEGLVATSSIQRDHLVVSFDARNHGHRVTNREGQKAWKQGNTRHAMDLYGMIVGDARDASFLVDFLPAYLFPQDDRTVAEFVITGKSLGGHATWHVLANDPRIKIGVPFIGMPDFSRLLNSRTKTSFVTNGPPYVPSSLKALVAQIDPANTAYDSFDARKNPFWGKKICVLSGANDKLVHWDWNEDFLKGLVVGEPSGSRGEMSGLKIHRRPGVGHEVTEDMVEEAGEWIWRWGVLAPL